MRVEKSRTVVVKILHWSTALSRIEFVIFKIATHFLYASGRYLSTITLIRVDNEALRKPCR
jgi:hypothetical protein